VILYERMVGTRPFQGRNAFEIQQAIVKNPAPSLKAKVPSLSEPLDALCHRAQAKNPEDRFPGAKEMATTLEEPLGPKI
jgi:hypothetical protein